MTRGTLVVLLKGYPRLSETFIAQELLGLQRAGFDLYLVSLRHPTDKKRHPVHDEITAPILYLPEYLHDEPMRVARGVWRSLRNRGFWPALRRLGRDFARDRTRNRLRRFGQACVLAAELPPGARWLHAHFIHTPASVAAYASLISGLGWSTSAHAKDIWTTPDWDLTEKLTEMAWVVTCTESGHAHLAGLAGPRGTAHLSHHGLDLHRFAPPDATGSLRDGTDPANPVLLLSVGRAVPKKGYDVLLDALRRLPAALHWRLEHIGGGPELPALKAQADALGLSARIDWRGAQDQMAVLARYRASDAFVLACRITADGDRDGLPNVLVEASSQRLPCLSTAISGVPELLTDEENGLLVPSEDPAALTLALERLIRDPHLRARLGNAACNRVNLHFDHHASIRLLTDLFRAAGLETA
jgi:glycosyltransferase involved in cell wall biosynthesis